MNVLAVIPARGGSKGIARKNITPLCGRPLLAWTALAALGSRLLSRVILSSDDAEIITVARDCGLEVPFVRPPELSGDDTPGIDVLLHAVQNVLASGGERPDAVMLLQPTSPLRTAAHIDAAIELFAAHPEADSLVSVVDVPHNMAPESVMLLTPDGYVRPYLPLAERRLLRQHKPKYVARNGAAIYLVRLDILLREHTLFGERILPLPMCPEDSWDIDTPFDLTICEHIIKDNRQRFGNDDRMP